MKESDSRVYIGSCLFYQDFC